MDEGLSGPSTYSDTFNKIAKDKDIYLQSTQLNLTYKENILQTKTITENR